MSLPDPRRPFRFGCTFILLLSSCSSRPLPSGNLPPASGDSGTLEAAAPGKPRCAVLLACCAGYPTTAQTQCRATATDPNESDFQCDEEILTAANDGYCDIDGNPVAEAGTADAGASPPESDAAPGSDSSCASLGSQACVQCCAGRHPTCVQALDTALAQCACTPGECGSACGPTFCVDASSVPMTGSCSQCLTQVETGDCSSALASVYGSNTDCAQADVCQGGCPQ